jgi:hypothetical protein
MRIGFPEEFISTIRLDARRPALWIYIFISGFHTAFHNKD